MKYATLLLGIAIMLAAIPAFAAEPPKPRQSVSETVPMCRDLPRRKRINCYCEERDIKRGICTWTTE